MVNLTRRGVGTLALAAPAAAAIAQTMATAGGHAAGTAALCGASMGS